MTETEFGLLKEIRDLMKEQTFLLGNISMYIEHMREETRVGLDYLYSVINDKNREKWRY